MRLRDFSWIQDDAQEVLEAMEIRRNVGRKLRQPPKIQLLRRTRHSLGFSCLFSTMRWVHQSKRGLVFSDVSVSAWVLCELRVHLLLGCKSQTNSFPQRMDCSPSTKKPTSQASQKKLMFEDMLAYRLLLYNKRQQSHDPNDPKSPVFCQRKKMILCRCRFTFPSAVNVPTMSGRTWMEIDIGIWGSLGQKKDEGFVSTGQQILCAGEHLTPESILDSSLRSKDLNAHSSRCDVYSVLERHHERPQT